MKRAVLLFVLAGCGFAQKHPGVTIGIVSGSIAFGACGLAVEKLDTCSIVGGSVGLGLGLLTGTITLLAETSEPEPAPDQQPQPYRRIDTKTEPPPGLPVDAGVGDAPAPDGA